MAVDANGNEIINSDESESQKRIKQLSDKVETTAKERDERDTLIKERDTKIAELEKENAFSSGFGDMLGTHSAAKDHKDEIKAKVLSGYSVEDATLAVLAKAGKLGAVASSPQVAGGSAATAMPQGGQKSPQEMTQTERRAQLEKDMIWQ